MTTENQKRVFDGEQANYKTNVCKHKISYVSFTITFFWILELAAAVSTSNIAVGAFNFRYISYENGDDGSDGGSDNGGNVTNL